MLEHEDARQEMSDSSLRARMDEALGQHRAQAAQPRCWLAYVFPLRAGVALDVILEGRAGGAALDADIIVGSVGDYETREAGLFMLYEADAEHPSRVEIYNLERRRDYEGIHVYRLGRAGGEESLNLLRDLIASASSVDVAARLVDAVALHEGPRAESVLRDLLAASSDVGVRAAAISWLARLPGNLAAVEELISNPDESDEVRRHAAAAMKKSTDPGSAAALGRLYGATADEELRRRIINSLAKSKDEGAVAALRAIERDEADKGLRDFARSRLEKRTGGKAKEKSNKKGWWKSGRRSPERDY